MSSHEFEIDGISKSYRGRPALEDLSLSIPKASLTILLGANGSGKSTLLKCIAGHQNWDRGTITRRNRQRTSDHQNFNQGLHLISEDIMPPMLSLKNLKTVYAELFGSWNEMTFQRLISYGRLDENRDLQSYSRGQRIQAIIALTIATDPETLLIDEVTAVLDPYIRNRFFQEMVKLVETIGTTLVIATNIATELTKLKGRLIIMDRGQIALDIQAKDISQIFIKIRTRTELASTTGFTFLETNIDGLQTYIGKQEAVTTIDIPFEADRRGLTPAEVFAHYSERK